MKYSESATKEQSFKEPESRNWFRFFYVYMLSISSLYFDLASQAATSVVKANLPFLFFNVNMKSGAVLRLSAFLKAPDDGYPKQEMRSPPDITGPYRSNKVSFNSLYISLQVIERPT